MTVTLQERYKKRRAFPFDLLSGDLTSRLCSCLTNRADKSPQYKPRRSRTQRAFLKPRSTLPSSVYATPDLRSDEADRLSIRAAVTVAEKEWLFHSQGLPGTAVRGPACTVVWELGGAILPATRFDSRIIGIEGCRLLE